MRFVPWQYESDKQQRCDYTRRMFKRENWTLCIFAHGKLAQYKFTQHLIDQQVMLTTETYLHKMHQTKFHSMYFPKAYVHWTKLQNYTPMWRSPLHIFTWIDYHKVANYLLRQNLHKSFRNVGGKLGNRLVLLPPPPVFPTHISLTRAYPWQQWGHHESNLSSHTVA